MLSIGWVMFWKAVVIAAWLALVAHYQQFKRRRREAGVVLRYDARKGVHYDPLERTERRIKMVVYVLGAAFLAYAVFVVAVLLGY